LAVALRDQGLADYLAARFALRPTNLKLFGRPITFAHLVVAKSQQAVEKLTKGYLLWHSKSFDPTKGHAPFTHLLKDQPQEQSISAFHSGIGSHRQDDPSSDEMAGITGAEGP
jgi:hypothetical protein